MSSCVYRFEAQRGESVRIVLYETRTANRTDCATRLNKDSGRLQCFGNSTAHLRMWEVSLLDDTRLNEQVETGRTVVMRVEEFLKMNLNPLIVFKISTKDLSCISRVSYGNSSRD